MDPTETAAKKVAPGSVETPGIETTTQAVTEAPSQPVSREDRRRSIADWLNQPARTPTNPQDKTASTDSGQGSPPEGQGGASEDLSQSPPSEEDTPTSSDETEGSAPSEGELESTEAPKGDQPKGQWPREAVERVRKLKDQKQQLKAELAARDATLQRLEADVRDLRATAQKPPTPEPKVGKDVLAGETDAEVIRTKAEEASSVVTWAEDLLDDVVDNPEHVSAALEAEGLKAPEGGWSLEAMRQSLRAIKTNARNVTQAAPKRLEFLQREDQCLAATIGLAPDLGDPDSDLSKRVAAVVATRDFIKSQPDWPLLATAAVVGLQVLQERQKARSAGGVTSAAAVATRLVPKAPRMPGAPRSTAPASKATEVDVIRERATRPGATREDRLALIKARLAEAPLKA